MPIFPTPRDVFYGNPASSGHLPEKSDLVRIFEQTQALATTQILKGFVGALNVLPATGNTTGDIFAVMVGGPDGGIYKWDTAEQPDAWDKISALPVTLTLDEFALLAQAWAESDTSPDGDPDSKSSKAWAIISQTAAALADSEGNATLAQEAAAQAAVHRLATGADVVDAEAARDAAEISAGAAAAHAAGQIYPDEATGRAAVADGVYFFVEGANPDQFYNLHRRIDAATATVSLRTYPTLAYVQGVAEDVAAVRAIDPAQAYVPMPVHSGLVSPQNLLIGSDLYFSRTTGTAGFIADIALTEVEKLWSTIEVRLPARGTFSVTPFAQLLGSSGQIGANVNGVLDAATGEYVMLLPVSGDPLTIRARWSSTSDGASTWPYIIQSGVSLTQIDPQTPAGARVVAAWHEELFRYSGNLFTALSSFANVSVAPAATAGADRKTMFAVSGSSSNFRFPIAGLADADEYLVILTRLHSPSTTVRSFVGTVGDFQFGNSVEFEGRTIQFGEYVVSIRRAADGLGDPAQQASVGMDTRVNGPIPATNATLEVLAAFVVPDVTWLKKIIADPVRLMERLAAWEETTGYVAADVAAEGAERTYSSIVAAVRRGHKRVICGETQRLTEGLTIPGRDRKIEMTNGASLRGSQAYEIGDFEATAADANVYFRPQSYDPNIVIEVTGGTDFIRLGIFNPTGTGLFFKAASEAEVRSNAGSFWYGNGSEGIGVYLRPYGDVTEGKTWEIPFERARNLIQDQPGGSVEIQQEPSAVSGIARLAIVQERSSVTLTGGTWRSSGNNGWRPDSNENTNGFLKNALLTDASNDGWNSNPATGYRAEFTLVSARIDDNVSDGASAHGTGRSFLRGIGRCSISGNGKFDVVHIAQCDMDFEHLISRGSRNASLLYQHNYTEADTINIAFLDAAAVNFDTTNNVCNGRIVGIIDTIGATENVDIVKLATEA